MTLTPNPDIMDTMDEELYGMDDMFEREDDYNVWEEREIMGDYYAECQHEASGFDEEFDECFGSAQADYEAYTREEAGE